MKGFIYKITSPSTDKIYIGSTILSLEKRMKKHRKTANECNSKLIIALGDAVMECLEEVEYEDVNTLRQRESEYIRQYWDMCVNRTMLGRTAKEYMIEWHKSHRDKNNEKVVCELCGFLSAKKSLRRHQKSSNCKSI